MRSDLFSQTRGTYTVPEQSLALVFRRQGSAELDCEAPASFHETASMLWLPGKDLDLAVAVFDAAHTELVFMPQGLASLLIIAHAPLGFKGRSPFVLSNS